MGQLNTALRNEWKPHWRSFFGSLAGLIFPDFRFKRNPTQLRDKSGMTLLSSEHITEYSFIKHDKICHNFITIMSW